jgi:hypothetical protein
LRATKSVSEFTSTMAPVLPFTLRPMRPSAATRSAFCEARDRPFLRSQSTAFSMSPWLSVRAVLQSIMPAPVFSRSALTKLAVTSAIAVLFTFPPPEGCLPQVENGAGARPSGGL